MPCVAADIISSCTHLDPRLPSSSDLGFLLNLLSYEVLVQQILCILLDQ